MVTLDAMVTIPKQLFFSTSDIYHASFSNCSVTTMMKKITLSPVLAFIILTDLKRKAENITTVMVSLSNLFTLKDHVANSNCGR